MAAATESVWVSDTCQSAKPACRSALGCETSKHQFGSAIGMADHLDVTELARTQADAEHLHHRLFGGKPGGQAGIRIDGRQRVGQLPFGEQAGAHAAAAFKHSGEPLHIHHVNSDGGAHVAKSRWRRGLTPSTGATVIAECCPAQTRGRRGPHLMQTLAHRW